MTYRYSDPDGDQLTATPHTGAISLRIDSRLGIVNVPFDRVEEVVEGIRAAARAAAGGTQ